MDLDKKDYYICPNCGSYMFDEMIIEEVMEELNKNNGNISEEKIQEIIKNEKSLFEKAGSVSLRKFKDKISAMYKMLKDPSASPVNKVIAAIALLYIINPIDIIPDIIPGLGYLDDIAMILIAVGMLGSAIKKYMDKQDDKPMSQGIVYAVYDSPVNIKRKYVEKDRMRILSLVPGEMSKYNLRIINGSMVQPNTLYLSHPFFYKELISAESYDQMIIDSIFEEEMSLFAALGAKRIEYTREDIKSRSINAEVDGSHLKKAAEGKLDYGKYSYNKITKVREFTNCGSYNLNTLGGLVWYFTGSSNFPGVIEDRILNGLSKDKLIIQNDTSEHLDIKTRVRIGKLGLNNAVKLGSNILSNITVSVEYYERPEEVIHDPGRYYENILKILDKRKNDLENRYLY